MVNFPSKAELEAYYVFFLFTDAFETSKMLCEQYYLTSPDMEITEVNCKSFTCSGFLFIWIFPAEDAFVRR